MFLEKCILTYMQEGVPGVDLYANIIMCMEDLLMDQPQHDQRIYQTHPERRTNCMNEITTITKGVYLIRNQIKILNSPLHLQARPFQSGFCGSVCARLKTRAFKSTTNE